MTIQAKPGRINLLWSTIYERDGAGRGTERCESDRIRATDEETDGQMRKQQVLGQGCQINKGERNYIRRKYVFLSSLESRESSNPTPVELHLDLVDIPGEGAIL